LPTCAGARAVLDAELAYVKPALMLARGGALRKSRATQRKSTEAAMN
jgi:hypothetical protein